MSTKELAIKTIETLPDDVSWQELEERIHFMAGVEQARNQIKEGDYVPHDQVKEALESWITK